MISAIPESTTTLPLLLVLPGREKGEGKGNSVAEKVARLSRRPSGSQTKLNFVAASNGSSGDKCH